MPPRYRHTNLIARDWRRLARFYQAVFDCTPVLPERRLEGEWIARGTGVPDARVDGVHLRLPGHGPDGPTLEVFTYGANVPKAHPRANREGFAHLAFEVDDVAAALAKVLDHGGGQLAEVVTRTLPGVGRLTFVYATDPEGNLVELQSWGPEGPS